MLDFIWLGVTVFLLGFIIDLFVDFRADMIQWVVIHLGVGLALMPILGVFFNVTHIPISWITFLIVALMIFVSALGLRKKQLIPNIKIKWQPLLVLALVGVSMYMYIGGSYVYPWFENSDPWEYAEASKFIGETKTYDAPFYFNHFAEPYPQGYQIVMGTIYQINHSIYDTMKIFHNLIISLAVIFFFYFVLRLSNNYRIALLSSIFLWAIPAFFSHFIFALTFNMTIMLVFFYTVLKKWRFISILLFASLWVTHFYSAVIATVFLVIIYTSRVLATKKFNKEYIQIGFLGILLSMLFWVPAYFKYKKFDLMNAVPPVGGIEIFFPYLWYILIMVVIGILLYIVHERVFKQFLRYFIRDNSSTVFYIVMLVGFLTVMVVPGPGGIKYIGASGDRIYGLRDFFIAQGQGLFNNPIGIGLVVMSLFTFGMVFTLLSFKRLCDEGNLCLFTSFNLAVFSLMGVFGKSLSIGFIPFRMWTFFAIPCAVIAGITLSKICSLLKYKYLALLVVLLVCIGVLFTSFDQKYELNTSMWPEHKTYSPDAIRLYYENDLPKGTSMTGLCHPTYVASSYDYKIEPWVSEEIAFYYKRAMDETAQQNYDMFKKYNISYIIIDAGCAYKHNYGAEVLNQKVIDIGKSGLFEMVQVSDTSIMFKVA